MKVMSANRERPLRTQEVYELVAETGVPGFDPRAQRDRNLVNRELSDLAGMSPHSHSKPAPRLLARVGPGAVHLPGAGTAHGPGPGAGVPGTGGGLREAAAAGTACGRGTGTGARAGAQGLVCGAAGDLPRVRHLPAPLPEVRGGPHRGAGPTTGLRSSGNLQLLCGYCNRVKGTRGKEGYRLKMAELRADNVATGVMVDEGQAVLTGKRLAGYHRGDLQG